MCAHHLPVCVVCMYVCSCGCAADVVVAVPPKLLLVVCEKSITVVAILTLRMLYESHALRGTQT